MRVIKTMAGVALFGIVAIAILLGLMWLDHNRETTLPTPTGPGAVGRTTYVWSDPAHQEGSWSVTVRANWRVTFRFADCDVFDVDYLDYH